MKRPETSLSDLGNQFGPYKLVRRLGVGGMAETFVAVKSGPGGFTQTVCLKLVLPFFREDEDFIRLFYREATLAAKLRHRNIVGVMDFGELEDTPYMALELVDGLDLRGILDAQERHRLPADYVALFGLELAEALQHAHNPPSSAGIGATDDHIRGIVHRDISPSNVLVSRQGEILLTDFGVAKAISDNSRKQSAVKGKIPYMSPEQLRAESLDGRADLFALGVVLFEALAGVRPYEGAHDPATIMLILKGEHTPLRSLAPDAPPGLCDVIECLIDPDKENRPGTAAALIESLDDFAPSPRVRQSLGRLVQELADNISQRLAKKGSGRVSAKTERLPDDDRDSALALGPTEPSSRVEASAPRPQVEAPPSERPVDAAVPERGDTQPVNLVRPPVERPTPRDANARRRASLAADEEPNRWSRIKVAALIVGSLLTVGGIGALGAAFWPNTPPDSGPSTEADRAPRIEQPSPEPRTEEPQLEPVAQPIEQRIEESPETDAPYEPDPAEPASPVVEAPPEKPSESQTESAGPNSAQSKSEPKQKKPARLTISVFPWGKIWIDGQFWGSAPLKGEQMVPGTYKIEVGQSAPSQTRVVRLKWGQRKTVEFDLSSQ